MANVQNNDCVRCGKCGYIYGVNEKSCPNCGTQNTSDISERKLTITESSEPVFNLLD